MPNNLTPPPPPLTRAAILALTGPALDEACAVHICRWVRNSDGTWLTDAIWQPCTDRNQVAFAESFLTETQQREYGRILTDLLFNDDDWKDTSVVAGERRVYETATASPTTRCHALLLAVVALE